MVGKLVSTAASRSIRHHEIDAGIDSTRQGLIDRVRKFSETVDENSRSKTFFSFGSKTTRSEKTGGPLDDICFLQYLPPKELREEEYVLSALMANSRLDDRIIY